ELPMSKIEAGSFNGMECIWFDNGRIRLAVTTDRGPRIMFCGWTDGKNLMAELPDAVLETPEGVFHLLGGHRLWYAPEVLGRTYWPDSSAVQTREENGSVT